MECYYAFSCGYSRSGPGRVRRGDSYTAINGSKVLVLHVCVVTGRFRVSSLNCNGATQWLWYERDGVCRGPTGSMEYGGDDIVHGLPEACTEADTHCRTLELASAGDGSRWDEI